MAYAWILSLAGSDGPVGLAQALYGLLLLIPLLIAGLGFLGRHGSTADRVRAWALIIVGLTLALALLLPFQPEDAATLMTLKATLLLAYGYVLADWVRQAFRNGFQPLWGHGLVLVSVLAAAGLVAVLLTGA